MSDELARFIRARLDAGDDPNDIQDAFETALETEAMAREWTLWGGGEWRRNRVCPVCGDGFAGACGHSGMYEGGTILRSAFVPGQYGDPAIVRCQTCGTTGTREALDADKTNILLRCETCRREQERDRELGLTKYVPLNRKAEDR